MGYLAILARTIAEWPLSDDALSGHSTRFPFESPGILAPKVLEHNSTNTYYGKASVSVGVPLRWQTTTVGGWRVEDAPTHSTTNLTLPSHCMDLFATQRLALVAALSSIHPFHIILLEFVDKLQKQYKTSRQTGRLASSHKSGENGFLSVIIKLTWRQIVSNSWLKRDSKWQRTSTLWIEDHRPHNKERHLVKISCAGPWKGCPQCS